MGKISRREFLKRSLAFSGAGIFLGAENLFGKEEEDRWSFLRDRKLKRFNSIEEIKSNCVPLCVAKRISSIMAEDVKKRNFFGRLVSKIKRDYPNFDKKTRIKFSLGEQDYVIPGEGVHCLNYKKYCLKCEEFLYNNLEGLEKKLIDWTIIKKGDIFEKDYEGKGFIVEGVYKIYTAGAFIENKASVFISDAVGMGPISYSYSNPHNFYMCLSAYKSGIRSPFSEIIPLTTNIKTKDFMNGGLNSLEISKYHEAITEGLSHHLTLKACDEFEIPNGRKMIGDELKGVLSKNYKIYDYVDQSVRWIEKNGLQTAFDIYMEDPFRYIQEIKKF
jgi:hypothetical protein